MAPGGWNFKKIPLLLLMMISLCCCSCLPLALLWMVVGGRGFYSPASVRWWAIIALL